MRQNPMDQNSGTKISSVSLSSLAFMSHHVLVLEKFFGYGSVLTYLLAASVAVGGVIWASIYHRCGNLIPGWISLGC